jgi:hypothetical protein
MMMSPELENTASASGTVQQSPATAVAEQPRTDAQIRAEMDIVTATQYGNVARLVVRD